MTTFVAGGLRTLRHARRPLTGIGAGGAAEAALSARAEDLARLVATGAIPLRWRRPGFARDVELVRGQLAPIMGRHALLASWLAEATRRGAGTSVLPDQADPGAPGPVNLAYSVRWLELAPRAPRALPAWTAWLAVAAD